MYHTFPWPSTIQKFLFHPPRLLKQDLSSQEKQLRSVRPPSPPFARHTSPLYQNIVPSTPASRSQEIIYENLKPYTRTGAKGTGGGVSMATLPPTPEPHLESEGSTVWLSESWKYNTIKKAPDFNIFEISDAESSTSRASSPSPARDKARNSYISEASDAASSTSRSSSPSPPQDKERKTLRSRLPMFIRERKGRNKEGDASPGQTGRHAARGDRKRAHHPHGPGSPAGLHQVKARRAGEKCAINLVEHKGSQASAEVHGDVSTHKGGCQSGADDGGSTPSRRLSKALSHNTVSDSSDNEDRSLTRGAPRSVRHTSGGDAAHHGETFARGLNASTKLKRHVPQGPASDSSDYDTISTGASWQDLTQNLISDSSDGEGGTWVSQWVQEVRSRAKASLGSEDGLWSGVGTGTAVWERRASPDCSRASPLISPAASLRSLQPGRPDGGDPPPSPRAPLTPPPTLRRLRKTHGCPGGLRKHDVSGSLKGASHTLRGGEGGGTRRPGHAHPSHAHPAHHNNHAHITAHNNATSVNSASPAHSMTDPISPAHTPVTTKTAYPTTNITGPAHNTNPTGAAHTPNSVTPAHTPTATSPAHSDWLDVGTCLVGAPLPHHHPQDPSRSLPQQAGE